MMNFMSEYVNWDEFLYDLPVMVTELGKLMLFSDKRDFTLFKDGVTYKYIQRPESFRATLVQVCVINAFMMELIVEVFLILERKRQRC